MSSSHPEIPSPQQSPREKLHNEILRLSDDEVSLAFALSYALQGMDFEQLSRTYDAVTRRIERRDKARAARRERFGPQSGDRT